LADYLTSFNVIDFVFIGLGSCSLFGSVDTTTEYFSKRGHYDMEMMAVVGPY